MCYRTEQYTVLQVRLCIFHPGNFTGWGSEGVNVLLWAFRCKHELLPLHPFVFCVDNYVPVQKLVGSDRKTSNLLTSSTENEGWDTVPGLAAPRCLNIRTTSLELSKPSLKIKWDPTSKSHPSDVISP